MKRDGVTYSLHHVGIPTDKVREGERHAASVGMWTSDDLTGPLPVQWHRFDPESPLSDLANLLHRPVESTVDCRPSVMKTGEHQCT